MQSVRAVRFAIAFGAASVGCDGYSEPTVAFPTVAFKAADGTPTPLQGCPSSQADPLLTANGADVGVLQIANQNGGAVLPDKYQLSLASTDGRLTFALPGTVGDAAVLQSASAVSVSVSVPGQVDEVLVRAGAQSGDAHIAVSTGFRSEILCLPMAPSLPTALSVLVGESTGAPSGWTAYQLTASLIAASGTQVSDSFLLSWTATGCALLASETTSMLGTGSSQNTIYLPPGWTQSEITVTASDSINRRLCLTPGGGAGANASDGKCPPVSAGMAGDAGASPTIICPAMQ